MLIDISSKEFKNYFPQDPNPFVSEEFINLTKHKIDRIVRLISSDKDVSIGLVAGIKGETLLAPFSAPFGGFHYKHETIFYDRIYDFLNQLKQYVLDQKLDSLNIALSPNIYNPTINAKLVNAFIRLGFTMQTPDIISCVDLRHFSGEWSKSEVRQNCNRAIRNGLSFSHVTDEDSIKEAYGIILANRKDQQRHIFMSLNDLLEVNEIFPVDFFLVRNIDGDGIGSGVFYRGHNKIVQGVFVGDLLSARRLTSVDLLYLNIFNFYKEKGFDFIDLGKSSSDGDPNIGLIRFKEIHNCISTLGYTFLLNDVKSYSLR